MSVREDAAAPMTPTPAPVNVTPPDPMSRLIDERDKMRRDVIAALAPTDSGLVAHAIRELTLVNELDDRGAYGGMVGRAALDLVRVLASQGHSGGSVHMTLDLFERLARFDVLSPLTAHPAEWIDRSEYRPGLPREWQSVRKPSVFWTEGDATWHDIDDTPAPKEAR